MSDSETTSHKLVYRRIGMRCGDKTWEVWPAGGQPDRLAGESAPRRAERPVLFG